MPIFEWACPNRACPKFAQVEEHYVSRAECEDPLCECGTRTQRLVSSFGVVFTGPITAKYNDSKIEGAHEEGHWAYRTKDPSGKKIAPVPVWIDSFQAQRDFCREEGLVNPKDLGPVEVGSNGKSVSSRGMPGCW